MANKREFSDEALERLGSALASLAARRKRSAVPDEVDPGAIRRRLKLSQADFARRYALPLASLRKWEQGSRAPGAAARAYLTVIARDPRLVAESLSSPAAPARSSALRVSDVLAALQEDRPRPAQGRRGARRR